MVLLIITGVLTILVSFLCSIWEAVLLKIPLSYVQIKLKEGKTEGKVLKSFVGEENIDRPLSAILTLNTLSHTVGVFLIGLQVNGIWESGTELIPGISIETFVASLMTLLILIASEIIPKTIGAIYWKRLAGFTAISLQVIIRLLFPFVWISEKLTNLIKPDKNQSVLSRAEFDANIERGIKEGIFPEQESGILQNLLNFDKVLVKNIMTPRLMMKSASEKITIQDFYNKNNKLRFSRIPVYSETIDNVDGFVLKDTILENLVKENGDAPLSTIKRKIAIINDSMPIPEAFKILMNQREHIALVVDEFGGTEGIVTMEDIIETLLGMEIVDEFDNVEDLQLQARKNWEKRAEKLGLFTEMVDAMKEEQEEKEEDKDKK